MTKYTITNQKERIENKSVGLYDVEIYQQEKKDAKNYPITMIPKKLISHNRRCRSHCWLSISSFNSQSSVLHTNTHHIALHVTICYLLCRVLLFCHTGCNKRLYTGYKTTLRTHWFGAQFIHLLGYRSSLWRCNEPGNGCMRA